MCKTYIGSLLTLKFVVHLALSPLGRTGRVWANCSFRKTALANGLFSNVKLSGTLILLKYMYYHTISLTCQSYEANVPFCPQSVLPVLPLHLLVWNKHEAFTQCCFNVSPTSLTLAKHWKGIEWIPCVWWEGRVNSCCLTASLADTA